MSEPIPGHFQSLSVGWLSSIFKLGTCEMLGECHCRCVGWLDAVQDMRVPQQAYQVDRMGSSPVCEGWKLVLGVKY